MKITTLSKMILSLAMIACIGAVSLPVSAHENSASIITETSDIVISGTLEDGTPYTLSILVPDGDGINIVDSQYYSFKAEFPYGSNPPATMNVSIPMNGGIYKGTLTRYGDIVKDPFNLCVYAYYGGTIIGVI